MREAGFNEGKVRFSSSDVRFTQKSGEIYAIVLGWPGQALRINALGNTADAALKIKKVTLLGSQENVRWKQEDGALVIEPSPAPPGGAGSAAVYKIRP